MLSGAALPPLYSGLRNPRPHALSGAMAEKAWTADARSRLDYSFTE